MPRDGPSLNEVCIYSMMKYYSGMPILARLDAPGVLHHIMIRGIECRKIFRNNKDHDDFLERLSIILPETNTSCYTWAFLDTGHVLGHFGKSVKKARNEYLVFVRASASQGQKPELVG